MGKEDAEPNIYVNTVATEKLSHPEEELKTAEKGEVHSSKPESKRSETEITEPTEKAVEIKDIIVLSDKSTKEEKVDIDAGHLKLIIHSGSNLIKTDIIGKSDPYVVVEHNKKKFKSKTVKNNQNPHWDFVVDWEIAEKTDEDIEVSVFDEDIGKDDPMGYVFLDIKDLCFSQSIVTRTIPLNNCKTGEISFSSFYHKHGELMEDAEPYTYVNTEAKEKLSHPEEELKTAEKGEVHSSKPESKQSETEITEPTEKAVEMKDIIGLSDKSTKEEKVDIDAGHLKLIIHSGSNLIKPA